MEQQDGVAIKRITDLLIAAGGQNSHLPPTLLYNEGWLLRLVLDWFSRQPWADYALAFRPQADWYTEALLPTQFRARHRGDGLAESHTHADGVIGHFQVGLTSKGHFALRSDATQFVVTEAKLFSPLSSGTKRAPEYDQAARNVACMAHVVDGSRVSLKQLEVLRFVVLAPKEQIDAGVFGDRVSSASALAKVRQRVAAYAGAKDYWCGQVMEPVLERVQLELISWEDVLLIVAQADAATALELTAFYNRCLTFNRPLQKQACV